MGLHILWTVCVSNLHTWLFGAVSLLAHVPHARWEDELFRASLDSAGGTFTPLKMSWRRGREVWRVRWSSHVRW
jgi:hypothetical protein